jgi:hypothetical protein
LEDTKTRVYDIIKTIKNCIDTLSKVVLRESVIMIGDHVDQSTKNEEENRKYEWQDRKYNLKRIRLQHKIINNIQNDDFEKIITSTHFKNWRSNITTFCNAIY